MPDNLLWYAVRIQSRLASVAAATLRGKGYQEFLPLYRSRRRWSDRFKELDLPLFPGYLFCRFDVTGRLLPILTTPGVIGIVGAGKTPRKAYRPFLLTPALQGAHANTIRSSSAGRSFAASP